MKEIIDEILKEVDRAEVKHPDWPVDHVYGATIVAEESGELTRAALQYEAENGSISELRKEAVQTAATCIRLIKNLEENQTLPVTERVKSFADACKVLGLDPDSELPFKQPQNGRQTAIQSFTMMIIIAEALNEGWKPDYNNSDEPKYYPWFEWKQSKAGFGFSHTVTLWTSTYTFVGARLVFKTEELAAYAGKQFQDIYNGFITLKY